MKNANLLDAPVKILVLAMLFSAASSSHTRAKDAIETAGDVLVYLVPTTVGGATVVCNDGYGTMQFMESMALALGSTFVLKQIVREERPNHDDYHSFPSAHAAASFSPAEFVRKRYGWEYSVPAYLIAVFVAFSRVEAEQHYVHDVVAGALIGIASSNISTRSYDTWRVQAEVDGRYYGLSVSRSW